MKWTWFAIALMACSAAPRRPAGSTEPPPLPRPIGDRLHARLVDLVDQASVDGDLGAGWRSIHDHPQRVLRPYSRLTGDAAYRAVEIAFADADVADYATGTAARPHPIRAFDPVWNRTRAVYLSRSALYLPAGSTQRFHVRLPARPRLALELGGLTDGPVPRLVVRVDGEAVLDRTIEREKTWMPAAVDLGHWANRDVVLSFSVVGKGHGFFANPTVWAVGEGAAGPNVLVIVVDTLRQDALAVMPRLRQFAARGATFEQAVAASTWTRPALLGVYGGASPSQVGQSAAEMIPAEADRRRFYERAPPLLPRVLGRRGWRTSAIGNNFFLLAYPSIGLDFGFDEVDDIRHPVLDTPAIARGAQRYMAAHRDEPWLLHLHFDAPHWPYTPPAEHLRRVKASPLAGRRRDRLWTRYLAEAAYADEAIGQVLDGLERFGLASRTLVVVLGDHGEVFDPAHAHRVEALGLPTLHHHGWSAYDEVIHVPLVIALGGVIRPTTRATQVPLYDLGSTMIDYLGIAASELPGRSLRPVIEGGETAHRPALVEGQNVRALRDGRWLYLERHDGRLKIGGHRRVVPSELYDLREDAEQHADLTGRAKRSPELAATASELRRQLHALSLPGDDTDWATYHLELAADRLPHRLEGSIATTGRLGLRHVAAGEVQPIDRKSFRVKLVAGGAVEFTVDPPEAELTLELMRDSKPIARTELLVGRFGLPLIDGPLAGDMLSRLDSPGPPASPGGAVVLYRAPGWSLSGRAVAEPTSSSGDEVTAMMQRWGYAQPQAGGGAATTRPAIP